MTENDLHPVLYEAIDPFSLRLRAINFDKDPTSESVGCFSVRHCLSLTGVISSASSLNPLLHHWVSVLLNFTRFPLQKNRGVA